MGDTRACIDTLRGTEQDHLIEILEHGSEADRTALTKQLTEEVHGVDFHHLNDVLRHSLQLSKEHGSVGNIEPPPSDFLLDFSQARQGGMGDDIAEMEAVGYEAIHAGHVAFLILAGGSGSRLGVNVPKGLFICDRLQEKKSLFQLHCEKIRRREELATERYGGVASAKIQLLVMTSIQNDHQTREFFETMNYFGLSKEQVHFFLQSSLPCYDENTGKILMESSSRICIAPGGNGGLYAALANVPQGEKESVLGRMQRLGVMYIQIGNVDNMIAKVADPLFIACAIKEKAHVVAKTSPKLSPNETVGVFARVNGEWAVVEYTEIGERATEVDPLTGNLKFNCANISCYVCSVQFLQLVAERMKSFTRYHIARKKIATVNGSVIGIKLEAFIFDLFKFAKECVGSSLDKGDGFRIMQVDRSEEFAPIKNSDDAASDTPAEAASLLCKLHTRWLIAALTFAAAGNNCGVNPKDAAAAAAALREKGLSVEISPLASSEGEGLEPFLGFVTNQILHGSSDRIVILHPSEFRHGPSSM